MLHNGEFALAMYLTRMILIHLKKKIKKILINLNNPNYASFDAIVPSGDS